MGFSSPPPSVYETAWNRVNDGLRLLQDRCKELEKANENLRRLHEVYAELVGPLVAPMDLALLERLCEDEYHTRKEALQRSDLWKLIRRRIALLKAFEGEPDAALKEEIARFRAFIDAAKKT